LPETISATVNEAFGMNLLDTAAYNLREIVEKELPATTPLVLCSVPGFDAGYKIEALVLSVGADCTSIAMGSDEGLTLAERAIANAARTGSWVLLKNTHLASAWLGQLEKRLKTINPHRDFRLFLTMETVPSIPVNVLLQARILMNEPLPGIRANLIDTLDGIPDQRLQSGPAEKGRLYLMLSWLHAVVQERLRYTPLGWSKVYEFNDADMSAAMGTIDRWLNKTAQGRANIGPANIPWSALRTLLKHAVYGGRIDSDFDQTILDTFVDALFNPKVYEADFELAQAESDKPALLLPEGTSMDSFRNWAKSLPEKEPASWLRLPAAGEQTTALTQGELQIAILAVSQ
jgi:dynein heavy chain 1